MKIIVGNIVCKAIIGGTDFLGELDIMKVLREYLRVRPDGYGHATSYKKHQWDGYRYFITKDGRFATGFLPMVSKYLEELGVTIEIVDERVNLPELQTELSKDIGVIDGEFWEGRDYQINMVSKLNNYITVAGVQIYFPRGIYDCATNAGKNSISALIVQNMKEKYQTIFLVSSKEIYKQAVAFFSQVIGEEVGEICSGKYAPKRFTVAMVKSLYIKAKDSLNVKNYLNSVQVLIVDESDEAGADEYSKCLSLINAGMRIFVSGTPLESKKVNNMISVGLSGKVLGIITNKYLIDNGYSQRPLVKIYLNESKKIIFPNYTEELSKNIYTSQHRAETIAGIINENSEKYILISFFEKEHGYFMYETAKRLCPNIDMNIVHGSSEFRTEIMEDFKNGRITVLFISMIGKRGLNFHHINMLIMGQGGKSVITVKQFSGRALRHDKKTDTVDIIDFYDTGKYLGTHSSKRIKIYEKEEFEVQFMYPNRKGKPIN